MTNDYTPRRPATDPNTDAPLEGAPVRNPTEARQAAPDGRVRWVLLIGIAAVIVAFFFAYLGTRP